MMAATSCLMCLPPLLRDCDRLVCVFVSHVTLDDVDDHAVQVSARTHRTRRSTTSYD